MSDAGFETRRNALADFAESYSEAGGTGDGMAAAESACGPAIERVEAANVIIARSDGFVVDPDEESGVEPSLRTDDFVCESGAYALTLTNTTNFPIGAQISFGLRDETNDLIRSGNEANVIWSIAPGASERVNGTYVELEYESTCSLEVELFDADPTDVDASSGVATRLELTGDDPQTWVLGLAELSALAVETRDRDAAADVEDIRSSAYEEVIANARRGGERAAIGEVIVCANGRDQPDPDHVSLIFEVEFLTTGADDAVTSQRQLSQGVFRRGADGQWRWLGTADEFVPASGEGCAGIGG